MFIRRKIKTLKGQSYGQHQLLKSVRTKSGPRQEVILNLGSLDLPKEQWKALANAIEEKLNNQSHSANESSPSQIGGQSVMSNGHTPHHGNLIDDADVRR